MRYLLSTTTLSSILFFASCSSSDPDPVPQTIPFDMLSADLNLDWAITREQEMPCGGDEVGGGAISGIVTFAEIGQLHLELSSVWDIENKLDPDEVEYEPEGPAGGPVATVFGKEDYPYDFLFNPFANECEMVVSATGNLILTADNGDIIFGRVSGGETHRLDFVMEGDGIETFAKVDIEGGTGEYEGATGHLVTHTITRFDFYNSEFVMDLATVLPGGTITISNPG